MPGSIRKAQIRNQVWDLLRRQAIVREPGVYGRTPRFRGASQSVARLRGTRPWREARRVLVLSEPVLEGVRAAALEDGKRLLIPDLRRTAPGWIQEIDPARLNGRAAQRVAREGVLPGAAYLRGREVAPVDLMVIGAVAVSGDGDRVGKGRGEADLVYALGRERGFLGVETPVAVVVHDLQMVEGIGAREPTDLPIDLIATPERTLPVEALLLRPKGLHPSMITPQRLNDFPGLRAILAHEGLAVPE
ncbi:MAG: 5-formyltetrahydrofolate cyclo-ligase [Candidatus Eisenbacteria bacterium]|nr:5-formyltetrahydrofolate cyclo-ligase [Candidatus Eisenbacteria bacterium]